MSENKGFVQYSNPIITNTIIQVNGVGHLGITAPPGSIWEINFNNGTQTVYIGNTGILEFKDLGTDPETRVVVNTIKYKGNMYDSKNQFITNQNYHFITIDTIKE